MSINTPSSTEKEVGSKPIDLLQNAQLMALFQSEGLEVKKKKADYLYGLQAGDDLVGKETIGAKVVSLEDLNKMREDGYTGPENIIINGVNAGKVLVETKGPQVNKSSDIILMNPIESVKGKEFSAILTVMSSEDYDANFSKMRTSKPTRVLKVDDRIMGLICGDSNAESATIRFEDSGMIVKKGDYIADEELHDMSFKPFRKIYRIHSDQFEKIYEFAPKTTSKEDEIKNTVGDVRGKILS